MEIIIFPNITTSLTYPCWDMYCYTMKNAVFWDFSQCGFIINRRFGETFRLNLEGRRNNAKRTLFLARVISPALKMEAKRSSET
jgi:hypothetical protein